MAKIPDWLKKATPGAEKAEELKQRSPKEVKENDRQVREGNKDEHDERTRQVTKSGRNKD